MKRILSFIICVSLLVSILPQVSFTASAEVVGLFEFSIINETAILAQCNYNASGDIVIPQYVGDYPVVAIGPTAFSGCGGIKSITIPDGVISIGNNAFFSCPNLENVVIPDSVISIDYNAFHYCTSLKEIVIPEGVTTIGKSVFEGCESMTSVSIPNTLKSIPDNAFLGCGLESVIIPDSVTSIGEQAFGGCRSLKSATIPNSVTSIGKWAFGNCEVLESIVIPDSVSVINEYMFYNCYALKSITIPNSVVSIGKNVTGGCLGLTDVYYHGSKADWDRITVEDSYGALLKSNFHYIMPETETSVSSDGKTFTVKPVNVPKGKTVILALYSGDIFADMQKAIYQGEDLTFTTDKEYSKAKIMVWHDMTNLRSVSNTKEVEAPEDDSLVDSGKDDDSNFGDWGV